MRHTPEAACSLWLGCWSNNSANSHPSPGTFNQGVMCTCLVPQCSYPPHHPAINNALRIVTGCLHPTPADNLPILAGIQPAELCRNGATQSLARCAMESGILLHSHSPIHWVQTYSVSNRNTHLYTPHSISSVNLTTTTCVVHWPDHQWNVEWTDNATRLCIIIFGTSTHPPIMTLPRGAWFWLDRACNSVWHFCSSLYKWGMTSSAACVAQKNKPLTLLSSNVQSIDIPMDCMAWRFWTMRHWNGCSTSWNLQCSEHVYVSQLSCTKIRRSAGYRNVSQKFKKSPGPDTAGQYKRLNWFVRLWRHEAFIIPMAFVMHHLLEEFNTSGAKVLNIVTCIRSLSNAIK